jgi:plasmid stabilization system protein ParE
MAFEIIWTKQFLNSFYFNIEYLETNWPQKIQDFVTDVDEIIEKLSHYPFLGEEEDKYYNIRGIVISKIHTIYYRIENEKIYLVDLFDNRRDPETKLKK